MNNYLTNQKERIMHESLFLNVSMIFRGNGEVFKSFEWDGGLIKLNGPEEWEGNCDVHLETDAGIIKVKAKYPQIQWAQPGDYLKCKLEITPMGEVVLNSATPDPERNVLNKFINESRKNDRN